MFHWKKIKLDICRERIKSAPKRYSFHFYFVSLHPITKKCATMVIVTGRDYRANLAKYYGIAKQEDVIVKTRYGSWKVVPITEDDVVVNKRDLPKELCNALLEVKESMEGKKNLLSWEELVSELDD